MNLYDKFLELHKDPCSYYYDFDIKINPILNPSDAYQFIEDYFIRGAKEKAFDTKYIVELKKYGKHLQKCIFR